jgi:urease accessory protein
MPWQANLKLDYRFDSPRTVLRHDHDGPLRIFKSLYPEGDAVCHNVIVHPPGGLVGGDELAIAVSVGTGAHAFISTPGATRFYSSDELVAAQRVRLSLAPGSRLEWLPLEAIAYPGCRAVNHLSATLAPGAELLAWDVTALGLPMAEQAFHTGCFSQRLEIPGLWLEQARIDAADTRLLNAPLGLGGKRCLGTLFLACATPLGRDRQERLLETVRTATAIVPEGLAIGATCPNPNMLVLRAMAPLVEPLMAALQMAWAALRTEAWAIDAPTPRIWQV